jgi:hypothetical protein
MQDEVSCEGVHSLGICQRRYTLASSTLWVLTFRRDSMSSLKPLPSLTLTSETMAEVALLSADYSAIRVASPCWSPLSMPAVADGCHSRRRCQSEDCDVRCSAPCRADADDTADAPMLCSRNGRCHSKVRGRTSKGCSGIIRIGGANDIEELPVHPFTKLRFRFC